ncbi:hypothetical protein CLHOM_24230 [Clostridium homopropionicum DSM 5847]|uniref:DUF4386 domain-containing protein n=1 Tax=Clostridium homopropionicum DSM 5847 TaxID=1121318 RepID=A0A0L6Z8M0_9CLOT|nr:DUF4386 domain-containing protein [Clostridium homopropionicum]KOA19317.1 hypothetical protein CLHOM_24230 [Clostridium homopropionicum DSM 5847]SFG20879.1 protein of unknown function [Clostridium homopropionicum]
MNMEKHYRGYERIIGFCFLLATVTYAVGNQMIENGVYDNVEIASIRLGIGFELMNSFAVVVIGWLSFIVLKSYNKTIIRGYMISRLIEGFLLAIVLISQTNIQAILKLRELCFSLAMLSLGGYSIYYCWYLLQKSLAPKWMMGLGILGYVCLFVYSVLLFISQPAPMWLFAPGGLYELIFPIYLIVKGFNRKFNNSMN